MDSCESSECLHEKINSFNSALMEVQRRGQLHLLDAATISCLDKALSSVRSTVRVCHNALRPVYLLSPEVLGIIFRYVLEDSIVSFPHQMFPDPRISRYQPRTSSLWPPDSMQTLMSLMLVCRRWRDTLLTFGSLWSVIIIPTVSTGKNSHAVVKNIDYCLRQSVSAPLRIYANLPSPNSVLSRIAEHTSRLKVLHLKLRTPGWAFSRGSELQQMGVFLSRPAPTLECLTIDGHYTNHLPRLFNDQSPSLRRLALLGFSSWEKNNFTTLTHLTINAPHYDGPGQSNELTDILDANPRLEEINLCGINRWFDRHSFDPASANVTITLDHLERLSLTDCTPEQAQTLLACLKLPCSTSLNMGLVISMIPPPVQNDIFTFLPHDTSGLENIRQITKLAVHIPGDPLKMADVVALGPHAGLYSRYVYNEEEEDLLAIGDDEPIEDPHILFYRSSFFHLSQLPFLANIQELWLTRDAARQLDSGLMILAPTYRALFEGATSLSKLHLYGDGKSHLLDGLLPEGCSHDMVTPCQHLRALVIHGGPAMPHDALLRTVKQRKELGFPIHELSGKLIDGDLRDASNQQYLEELSRHVEIVDPRLDPPTIEVPAKWGAQRHAYWDAWQLGDHRLVHGETLSTK